jgi:hypothetical protein
MRYGRLFTPGTDAGGGIRIRGAATDGRNAYRRAVDSGLLYAEGYACRPRGMRVPVNRAWCLDGETVVDPEPDQPGTAYFGVALRPGYLRRVHEAQRNDDGSDGFTWAFIRHEQENPPLDPAADIVLDLGRDIPSSVRDWALTSERHPGRAGQPPAWVLDELLRFADRRPADPDPYLQPLVLPAGQRVPDTDAGPEGGHDTALSGAPLPVSHAWHVVRLADWFDSGMALQCSGRTGGVFSDNGTILGKIRDGDGLDTLIRLADEHRPRCEWAASPGSEPEQPGPTAGRRAEVHLRWVMGSQAGRSFAVLHRLDHNVWEHPSYLEGQTVREEPPVRLTRNGVSYEMGLTAAFGAMGDKMPEEFAVIYLPFVLPAEQRTPSGAPLLMSYARYLIRRSSLGSGLELQCSGRTGGVSGGEGAILEEPIQDGDSLDTLIRMADEHRPRCEWAVCPADEREHPELTAQKRDWVHLKWTKGRRGDKTFAVLHRLDYNVWHAWLQPSHPEGQIVREETAVRLTRDGVSYETALLAVFQAMGDEMPENFRVVYLTRRPETDPLRA